MPIVQGMFSGALTQLSSVSHGNRREGIPTSCKEGFLSGFQKNGRGKMEKNVTGKLVLQNTQSRPSRFASSVSN